ncbi:hypothetical protein DFJ73DRAFT_871789 [Zopfochytrium polystomum]|nr:hypothetical protein DFJ73DRAFT_871789 [Zopfochytrium polystomum]
MPVRDVNIERRCSFIGAASAGKATLVHVWENCFDGANCTAEFPIHRNMVRFHFEKGMFAMRIPRSAQDWWDGTARRLDVVNYRFCPGLFPLAVETRHDFVVVSWDVAAGVDPIAGVLAEIGSLILEAAFPVIVVGTHADAAPQDKASVAARRDAISAVVAPFCAAGAPVDILECSCMTGAGYQRVCIALRDLSLACPGWDGEKGQTKRFGASLYRKLLGKGFFSSS